MSNAFSERQWLTIPDLVKRLDLSPSRVHRLFEEKYLLGMKRDGVLSVPADFLDDEGPVTEIRGTLFVLGDAGFSDSEALEWLLTEEETMGVAPIDALRSGRKTEVRRIAQALG